MDPCISTVGSPVSDLHVKAWPHGFLARVLLPFSRTVPPLCKFGFLAVERITSTETPQHVVRRTAGWIDRPGIGRREPGRNPDKVNPIKDILHQGQPRLAPILLQLNASQCRSRKSRCGALPPETCPYCKKHGLVCVWPEVDGRKTRPRQGQAPAAPFTSFNPSEPLSLHNAIGLQPSTDNEGSAAAWLNLIFSNEVNRVEHPASTAHAGFETLLASSSVENDPHSTAPLDNGVGTTGEGFGTSFGLPQNSLHDVTGVDPASFFREFFDRDFGDVQMQISAENGPTPHTSGDGAISIKVSRAHGRTAFVPGEKRLGYR